MRRRLSVPYRSRWVSASCACLRARSHPMLKIATWNVNSIKARRERLLAFLQRHAPDVVCLQELKVETEAFPLEEVNALGYQAVVHGQRSYNGVAILAKAKLEDPTIGLPDGGEDA